METTKVGRWPASDGCRRAAIPRIADTNFPRWPAAPFPMHSRPESLHFSLFCHFQRVVDFNAEVLYCALELRMTKQQLHRSQVFGAKAIISPSCDTQSCSGIATVNYFSLACRSASNSLISCSSRYRSLSRQPSRLRSVSISVKSNRFS